MARRAAPAISLEMDAEGGYAAAGFITGMTTEISTNRYIGNVLKYAHGEMAKAFDTETDMKAISAPRFLHHVYEWRMIGLPEGRLWRHQLRGQGSTREATFAWKASKAPILTPQERQSDPLGTNDPISEVDLSELPRLGKRNYVFYWKAPMMEYNLAARVRPRYARRLFIPTWSVPDKMYRFGMETMQDFRYANPQDSSGGPGTVGMFTAQWTQWWNTVAPKMWDMEVQRTIERDLGIVGNEIGKVGRTRKKTFGLAVFNPTAGKGADSSNFAAFEAGRNLAEARIKKQGESYAQASRYVDQQGVYGVDVDYGN